MLTTQDTPGIAEDLVLALHDLLQRMPSTIEQFWKSFAKRAKNGDLPESGTRLGTTGAMDDVLAGLLASNFQITRFAESPRKSASANVPEDFVAALNSALARLPHTHPLSLLLFKKHVLLSGCTSEQGLAALLNKYVANETVYPY